MNLVCAGVRCIHGVPVISGKSVFFIERIVYFGLLFNEMLSNTIEHSLDKDTKMIVSLNQTETGYSFSYKDGAAWNNDEDAGLGASLIPELVERVEGENYSLDSTQGLYYFEFES